MKPIYDAEPPVKEPLGPPPILGSWRRLYTFVILSQVVFVVILWILSESF